MKKIVLALLLAAAANGMEDNSATQKTKITFLKNFKPSESETELIELVSTENNYIDVIAWKTDMNLLLSSDPNKFLLVEAPANGILNNLYRVEVVSNGDESISLSINLEKIITDDEKSIIIYGEGEGFPLVKMAPVPKDRDDIDKIISFDQGNRSLIFFKNSFKVGIGKGRKKRIVTEFLLSEKMGHFEANIFSNGDIALMQKISDGELKIYYVRKKRPFQDKNYQLILNFANASPDEIAHHFANNDHNFFSWHIFKKLLGAPNSARENLIKYPNDKMKENEQSTPKIENKPLGFMQEASPTNKNVQLNYEELADENNIASPNSKVEESPTMKSLHSQDELEMVTHQHSNPDLMGSDPFKVFNFKHVFSKFVHRRKLTPSMHKLEEAPDILKFNKKILISLVPLADYLNKDIWSIIKKEALFEPLPLPKEDNPSNQISEEDIKTLFSAIDRCDVGQIDNLINDKKIILENVQYNNRSPSTHARKKGQKILAFPLIANFIWNICYKDKLSEQCCKSGEKTYVQDTKIAPNNEKEKPVKHKYKKGKKFKPYQKTLRRSAPRTPPQNTGLTIMPPTSTFMALSPREEDPLSSELKIDNKSKNDEV